MIQTRNISFGQLFENRSHSNMRTHQAQTICVALRRSLAEQRAVTQAHPWGKVLDWGFPRSYDRTNTEAGLSGLHLLTLSNWVDKRPKDPS